MMEAFKEGRTLNIKYAWPLVKQAKEIFSKESTIQVILTEITYTAVTVMVLQKDVVLL